MANRRDRSRTDPRNNGRSISSVFIRPAHRQIQDQNRALAPAMAPFPVSSVKEKQLLDACARLGIREQDIEEQFVRSSGEGARTVNKVSSCVYSSSPHRDSGQVPKEPVPGAQPVLARRLFNRQDRGGNQKERPATKSSGSPRSAVRKETLGRARLRLLADKQHREMKKNSLRAAVRPITRIELILTGGSSAAHD